MKHYVVKMSIALVMVGALFASSNAWAGSVVNVAMWDENGTMGLKLDTDTVSAGEVTFKGTNTSMSGKEHEMLVLKVDSDMPELPYNSVTHRVPESEIDDLGEIPELKVGESGDLTLDLAPGKYFLFCNIAGHYAAGMKAMFYVQ